MRGCLIVNHYIKQHKFADIYELLMRAALHLDVVLEMKTNVEAQKTFDYSLDFVLFWDKDTILASYLENKGLRLFNSCDCLEVCGNKALTYARLEGLVPMPKTYWLPAFYDANTDNEFVEMLCSQLSFPMIVKEAYGSFGSQVYMIKDLSALRGIIGSGRQDLIFQAYIKEAHNTDIRVQVVGGEVVCAMKRVAKKGDFRANITNGGRAFSHCVSAEEARIAVTACQKIKLDFGGVDLLLSKDGPVLCEINSNAHFRSLLDLTGVNTADYIIKHIVSTLSK